ncbi:hypothetical protein Htur_3602 [Haloterrigena turkmenica DSM 5511]|uniref:Uncharacterized protein n=1 Tax=Haloterrigena turkmenica (strain ATCC 51198 / DSM 5511 / JCM 9101 / NCIMB 13204 / VKM B-1734 / 4k) TaxID=543526 RepID=D2RR68_HALTV|nr:hypothetical protein [Haloterrigena turkmenica]ADB62464.1 hypothetical protein Htur_3602 [Haloterrigena turkmenica DSM 5511]
MADRAASATTVTLLPGHSENSSEGGDPLNSAMPDYDGRSLDAWFVADVVTDLPDDLETVREMRKHLPEYDEGLRQYRLANGIELSFTTPDGRSVVDSSVALETNADEAPSYVGVEGESGEENIVRDIIERDDLDWFDGKDKLRADVEDKRFESDAVRESVDGVAGVRAAVVFGGTDTYIEIMREKFYELGPVEFLETTGMDVEAVPAFIVQPPTMYTFLELAVMADGTTLARAWDASPYPKHYLYVDERKRDETEFEEGSRLEGGEWRRNENANERFGQWTLEEQDLRSPFSPHTRAGYEQSVDGAAATGLAPVMSHGEDGSELTASTVASALPPLFPW